MLVSFFEDRETAPNLTITNAAQNMKPLQLPCLAYFVPGCAHKTSKTHPRQQQKKIDPTRPVPMISAKLPLHKAPAAPREPLAFTLEDLFNPLKGFEQLGDDDSTTDSSSSDSSSTPLEQTVGTSSETSETVGEQPRRVHFADDSENSVTLIPSHRDYSDEEYFAVWSPPDEIEASAYRNRIEYAYEKHWRLVLEEDQFVLCSDGQYYHPVTVGIYLRQLERERKLEEAEVQREQPVEEEQDEWDSALGIEEPQFGDYTSASSDQAPPAKDCSSNRDMIIQSFTHTPLPNMMACVAA